MPNPLLDGLKRALSGITGVTLEAPAATPVDSGPDANGYMTHRETMPYYTPVAPAMNISPAGAERYQQPTVSDLTSHFAHIDPAQAQWLLDLQRFNQHNRANAENAKNGYAPVGPAVKDPGEPPPHKNKTPSSYY